jgi:hypothetical protein
MWADLTSGDVSAWGARPWEAGGREVGERFYNEVGAWLEGSASGEFLEGGEGERGLSLEGVWEG